MVYIKVLISYGNLARDSKLTAVIRHNGLVFGEIIRCGAEKYLGAAPAVRIIKNPTRGRVKVISISSVLTTGADIEGDIVERYVIAVI
ncbi:MULTISPECIES: hypothetical protein [Serratia]|uniref:hypothetical protein n=1 Tax=Serratia TaxID=613 RepID=UPI001185391C|nr:MULTISPECIES: hypothetical protein [Serratia]MBH2764902.1 hypothetical protein [Serratia marcescens]MDX7275407.1 hypothetical protein [Serratia marcescens]WPJ23059.1 hypothetical protein NAE95_18865 [Serratia marcescens]HEI8671814.1 hypothetical protein [Serratia marcescens]HEJ0105208.1 hypothetical protein [Serratia marcescens]